MTNSTYADIEMLIDLGISAPADPIARVRHDTLERCLGIPEGRGLRSRFVLNQALKSLRTLTSPFAGILEGPPEVHELWRKHHESLDGAAAFHASALRALARDVYRQGNPRAVDLRIRVDELSPDEWPEYPARTDDDLDDYFD